MTSAGYYIVQHKDRLQQEWRNYVCTPYKAMAVEWLRQHLISTQNMLTTPDEQVRLVFTGPAPLHLVREVLSYHER